MMRKGFVLALLSACAAGMALAAPRAEELKGFRAPAESVREAVKGFLWLEAEGFADYGNWRLDTQFTHKMGSAYLIAPGVCTPIGAARTTVRIPRAGTWRAWVRTKDWLPAFSPGVFALSVGGRRSAALGASKRAGWRWEKAGEYALSSGETEIALEDLSGAFARCDAVVLTTDADYQPPDDPDALRRERLRLRGDGATVADGGEYDVVVVGAGTAGMGASLAAARTGARTALVHDRPVLGGNSSVELGIGTDGAAGSHPNRKQHARETGLCEEANLVRFRTKTRTLSAGYGLLCANEPNLAVFPNRRVLSVERRADGGIAAAVARDTLTGRMTRYRAKTFIDCTGDGWVGVFAGAERMRGREARAEFGEEPAPETRDDLMMSGCLMDGYLAYRYALADKPVGYETPAWARVLPEGFTRHIRHIGPQWWIEHGGRFNELEDPERARDELVRISFAYWGWVKNESPLKKDAERAALVQVPYMNGRREGYRLTGDYVLTANDALEGRMFDDRISYGGWPLDTHDPLGIDNPNGNGYWERHPGVPEYSIPYRCLYSKNIPNLMFAGRCQSVTHIALGSVRVEATLFTLGQAAGTAAALAAAKGLSPREYGRRHIRELQQRLLKDDQYIPQLRNEDPLDLARAAKVSATSTMRSAPVETERELLRHAKTPHELAMRRATAFARGALERLEAVSCLLASTRDAPAEVTATLYGADELSGKAADRTPLGTMKGVVPARSKGLVAFRLDKPVRLARRYVWIELAACRGVSWLLRDKPLSTGDARAYGGRDWQFVPHAQYAFSTVPALMRAVDARPEYVTDGVARPVGDCVHGWVSDPAKRLPQAIRLDFARPETVDEIRLTFDTDLTPTRVVEHPAPLVRDYRVEGYDGARWAELAAAKDNDLRLRVHRFAATKLAAVRVTVTATWGDPSARIFEIRAYGNAKSAGGTHAAELEGLDCDTSVTSEATGYFRLERDAKGVWRFVTPGGHGFFLAANNGPARMTGDACPALGYSPYKRTLDRKYGKDAARWAAEVVDRLKSWRFNAISSWDPPVKGLIGNGLASVRVLQLGKSFAKDAPNSDSNLLDNVTCKGRFPNVFRADFADHCRRMAARFCARERENPWIVGWYTDNEITWRGAVPVGADGISGDASRGTGMYDAVARLPQAHSGRRALDAFLAEKGLKVGDAGVTDEVKRAFLSLVAERYYRIATAAIRAEAPHHLVLGCRFAGFRSTPDIAWREGGKWNDAMSVNCYPPADLTNGVVLAGIRDRRPISEKLREVYGMCGRPILLTEWSYPAKDTKCPCRYGAGQRVPTQRERAAASALFARTLIGEPGVVGYSHFRWVDQPALGRWKMKGGEDCNYGLVNEDDEPYLLLTEALTKVHGEMYGLRRRVGNAQLPTQGDF